MNVKQAFIHFFSGNDFFSGLGVSALPHSYNWPRKKWPELPDLISMNTSFSGNRYHQNMQLKRQLNQLWHAYPEHRMDLTRFIVKDWGGIGGNSPASLERMAVWDDEKLLALGISGVASYSKVLAIRDPETYAIYDARVAVSLNAVQLIAGCSEGMMFPYLPGRNKVTGDTVNKRGFSQCLRFKPKAVLESHPGWKRIPRNSAYVRYLDLLKALRREAKDVSIQEMEMALFADAEALVGILKNIPTKQVEATW